MATLTPETVRLYIKDDPAANYLITGEEFSNDRIALAIELTVDTFNFITPATSFTLESFPSKAILLYGALANLYSGQAAMAARNQLSYSDGGITIPIEERFQLYQSLAAQYGQQYSDMSKQWKIQHNMESGWGGVSSDYSTFPLW